jgi:hypothetical protein
MTIDFEVCSPRFSLYLEQSTQPEILYVHVHGAGRPMLMLANCLRWVILLAFHLSSPPQLKSYQKIDRENTLVQNKNSSILSLLELGKIFELFVGFK